MSREQVDPATSATRGVSAVETARLAPQPRSREQIVGADRDADAAAPHAREHRSTDELLTILLEEEASHGN